KTIARSDRSPARLLDRFQYVHARRLQCGQQADGQTSDERDEERETEGDRIDPDFEDSRNQVGSEREERAQRPLRHKQADDAPEHGDEHAFGDELAYDVGSAGTESEARGDF